MTSYGPALAVVAVNTQLGAARKRARPSAPTGAGSGRGPVGRARPRPTGSSGGAARENTGELLGTSIPAQPVTPSNILGVEVKHRRDAVHVAAIGELDLASAGLLARELDKLRRSGARHIVLDLRRLELIDSTGLRLVLESDALARADGHRFSLVSGPPAVQRVFEISGVLEQLRFVHP